MKLRRGCAARERKAKDARFRPAGFSEASRDSKKSVNGKGGEQENLRSYIYIGVDLSKQNLDVDQKGKYRRYDNKEKGGTKLLFNIRKQGEKVMVMYESTGNISRDFSAFLDSKHIPRRCLTASRIRHHAKIGIDPRSPTVSSARIE